MIMINHYVAFDHKIPNILHLPFLTFFGGVTIEVNVFGPLEGLDSDGDLIVFAMVLMLCFVVFF